MSLLALELGSGGSACLMKRTYLKPVRAFLLCDYSTDREGIVVVYIKMIFYFTFGPIFYKLPKGHQNDSLGYGYLLDPQALCTGYKSKDICKGIKECEEQVYDSAKCVRSVNVWLDDVNTKCRNEINLFEECNELGQACRREQHEFLKCESKLERPEWILDESLVYIERIKGPKLK